MEDAFRFRLFSELVGNDEHTSIKNYTALIKEKEPYQIILYNIQEARTSRSGKAKALVYAFDNLNYRPMNVKDLFKLETCLNYLALHSFPEYYLNPLAIEPDYQGEVNSIGNLYIDFKGKEKTINEVILDQENPPEVKKAAIKDYVNDCLRDMNSIIDNSLDLLKDAAFSKSENRKIILVFCLEIFLFVIFNFFLFFFAVYPFDEFQALYSRYYPGKVSSFFAIGYSLLTFLYDLAFIVFHSYKAKVLEPFNFAKRFLRKNEGRIFLDAKNRADRLFDYIYGASKSSIRLKNDITDFSMLSSSYIDYAAILDAEKKKTKRSYVFHRNLLFSITVLEILFFICTLTVYLFDLIFRTIL